MQNIKMNEYYQLYENYNKLKYEYQQNIIKKYLNQLNYNENINNSKNYHILLNKIKIDDDNCIEIDNNNNITYDKEIIHEIIQSKLRNLIIRTDDNCNKDEVINYKYKNIIINTYMIKMI